MESKYIKVKVVLTDFVWDILVMSLGDVMQNFPKTFSWSICVLYTGAQIQDTSFMN